MAEAYADARTAPLGVIQSIATGANGDVYLLCSDLRRVFRLDKSGRLEVWAGTGQFPTKRVLEAGDARKVGLRSAEGLAWDPKGRLIIAGRGDIYAVDGQRRLAVVAGNGRSKPLVDDRPALEVSVHPIGQITMGPKGEIVFFDSLTTSIREVGVDGMLGTFAGQEPQTSPRVMHSRVGVAVPMTVGLSIDAGGDVWSAERRRLHRLGFATGKKHDETGLAEEPDCVVSSIAHHGSGAMAVSCESAGELWLYGRLDGKARMLRRHVSVVRFDEGGAVWFAEGNRLYRMADWQSEPVHVAGAGFYGDGGPAGKAWFHWPHGVGRDAAGNLLVADRYHHTVRRIGRDGMIGTLAGNGEGGHTGDGGPAKEARLFEPTGVVGGPDGAVYILERDPATIRRVDVDGRISTLFQDGGSGAPILQPFAFAQERSGRLIFSDEASGRIFGVSANGQMETLAGTGHLSKSGAEGDALTTPMWRVSGLAPEPSGTLLFTQWAGSNLVRRLTLDGRLENVAGNDEVGSLQFGERDPKDVGLQTPGGLGLLPGEGTLISSSFEVLIHRVDGKVALYADSRDYNQAYAGIYVDELKNAYLVDYSVGALRVIRRSGGLAASPLRMARNSGPLRMFGRTLSDLWDFWPLGMLALGALIPLGVRRWRYWRQKARLLRGVDSDLSAVFSPGAGSPSPRAAVDGVLEGRYRIVECVANGGSAVVYRAEDLRNAGRMVAVKVFDLPDEDPVAVQRRLLRECVASSRVRHVSVAPMLDVGMTAEGQPFLVMEFVEGESLRALLRRGLMDRDVAVRLLGELADAVAAMHAQGVLHLDIKPENLMMRAENGRLVLIDFGLAAVAEAGALATHMSSVGGTLDYMAPEQLLGHVSAGADIYACGAVALEMLAGKRVAELELPPNNQDLALTAARVRAAVTGVPEEAVVVLARMLSLRPEERPTGLAELVRALG